MAKPLDSNNNVLIDYLPNCSFTCTNTTGSITYDRGKGTITTSNITASNFATGTITILTGRRDNNASVTWTTQSTLSITTKNASFLAIKWSGSTKSGSTNPHYLKIIFDIKDNSGALILNAYINFIIDPVSVPNLINEINFNLLGFNLPKSNSPIKITNLILIKNISAQGTYKWDNIYSPIAYSKDISDSTVLKDTLCQTIQLMSTYSEGTSAGMGGVIIEYNDSNNISHSDLWTVPIKLFPSQTYIDKLSIRYADLNFSKAELYTPGGVYMLYKTTDNLKLGFKGKQVGRKSDNTLVAVKTDTYPQTTNIGSLELLYEINAICSNAFNPSSTGKAEAVRLTEITFPDTVTIVEDNAFKGCVNLYKLGNNELIGNGRITTIGDYAFYNCSSLSGVNAGVAISSIGVSSFRNCTKLHHAYFNSTQLTSIPESCFENDTSLVTIAGLDGQNRKIEGLTGRIHIPRGVTTIGKKAFKNCTKVWGIRIPTTVQTIEYLTSGSESFNGCTGITEVYIDSNTLTSKNYTSSSNFKLMFDKHSNNKILYILGLRVYNLGSYAFYNCTNLESLGIHPGLNRITDTTVFQGCLNLKNLYINNSNVFYNVANNYTYVGHGENPFGKYFSNNLENLTIGDHLSYDVFWFRGSGLSTGPSSSIKIGNYDFKGQTKLKTIDLDSPVEKIGGHAFENCTALTRVESTWHYGGAGFTSLKTIGDYAFAGCSALKYVSLGSGVTYIGDYAFSSCTSLDTFESNIFTNVQTIGQMAFYNCTSMKIPENLGNKLTTIGNGAFYNTGPNNDSVFINIPKSVTRIEQFAFYGHDYCKKLYIGDSSDMSGSLWIGSKAFYGVASHTWFEDIRIYKTTPPTLLSYDVFGLNGLGNIPIGIHVPKGYKSVYQNHQYWGLCSKITDDL